ncbi:MAG TPA: PadR family transcriptional regulator [Thermotogota bacterium]|nr:PadR family transcriptional regulator [Thermotogota bacterium]
MAVKGILKNTILNYIARNGGISGYDFFKYCKEHGLRISTGTIYPNLKALVDDGFLEFHQEGRRKVYSLTKAGQVMIHSSDTQQDLKALLDHMRVVMNCNCDGVQKTLKKKIQSCLDHLVTMDWQDLSKVEEFASSLGCLQKSVHEYLSFLHDGC